MKKITSLLLLCLFLNVQLFSQQFKFAWLTDTHVGASGGLENLSKCVNDINTKNYDFVILSGDITESGVSKDLEAAKAVLDSLKIKYYIIPGNHDVKWSESCGQLFPKLWGSDHFNFTFGGIRFIGFSTGILLRNHGGHASPENLAWLEQQLKNAGKNEPLIIVTHHMIDGELDNWFDVTNRLKGYNIIALLCGHGHQNINTILGGIPTLMARTTLKNNNGWGYCSVSVTPDSLLVFEENGGTAETKLPGVSKKNKNIVTIVDSAQFINYNSEVVANINLNKTLSYGLFTNSEYIASASLDGKIFCFDINGKELWNYQTGGSILSRPAIIDNILIAGTIQGDLISIDCKTGKQLLNTKLDEMITSQMVTKKIKSGSENINVVLFGAASGSYFCYNVNTLKPVWKNSDAKGVVECEPLILNDKIFYGSWDTYLYCCNLSDGKNIWRWQGNDKFYYAPAACKPASDSQNVFVAAPDRFVSAVNINTGKTTWRTKEPGGWESIGFSEERKNVVVKGFGKKIYFVSPADGKVLQSVDIDNDIETMASEVIDVKGNTLLTTRKGMLYLVDNKFSLKPLMFLGSSKGHSVKLLNDNSFAVSNLDGRIVIFKLKEYLK